MELLVMLLCLAAILNFCAVFLLHRMIVTKAKITLDLIEFVERDVSTLFRIKEDKK